MKYHTCKALCLTVFSLFGYATPVNAECFEPAKVYGLDRDAGGLLNVRSGPGKNHPAIGTIKIGDHVQTCGFTDEWTQISADAGLEGWVSSKYIAPIDEAEPTRENVTARDGAKDDNRSQTSENHTGFRPNEKVSVIAAEGDMAEITSHSGRADGLYYRYYNDASGSVSKSDDILKPELWKFTCENDAMTDERSCSMHDKNLAIFFHFRSDTDVSICAMGHDYPGEQALIRINKLPPQNLGTSGCSGGTDLLNAVIAADSVVVRSTRWPRKFSVDSNVYLEGVKLAAELTQFLRKNPPTQN